jgi:hypothetical protein
VAVASDEPGDVTVGDETIALAEDSEGSGMYRAYFSTGGSPGTLVSATVPVWAMAECVDSSDEGTLYGDFDTFRHALWAEATCNHNTGEETHTCTCGDGYSGDGKFGGTGCTEIDACETSPCPKIGSSNDRVDCTDLAAPAGSGEDGRTCDACPEGYGPDPVDNVCMDTDGCAGVSCYGECYDVSAPSSGYECEACPTGTTGDGETCADIDDCAVDPCGSAGVLECTNTGIEMWECACASGYESVGNNQPECTHVNACDSGEDDCVSLAECSHVMGSMPPQHECFCPEGYTGDGTTSGSGCTDYDGCASVECAVLPDGGADTGEAPVCIDDAPPSTDGTCTACPPGYNSDPVGGYCTDANDCGSDAIDVCGAAATGCVDAQAGSGEYTCECADNFVFGTAGICVLDDDAFSGVEGWSDALGQCTGAYSEAQLLEDISALQQDVETR